jgi:hypothetical protein
MKTNSKISNKNTNKTKAAKNHVVKNVTNIAIAGYEGRAHEIRAILTKLGMKYSRNLTFNSNTWYYYVVDGVVRCSMSPFINGYKAMSIDTYYKEFKTSKAAILKRYGK